MSGFQKSFSAFINKTSRGIHYIIPDNKGLYLAKLILEEDFLESLYPNVPPTFSSPFSEIWRNSAKIDLKKQFYFLFLSKITYKFGKMTKFAIIWGMTFQRNIKERQDIKEHARDASSLSVIITINFPLQNSWCFWK